jgi:hypothetical protein
MRSRVIPGSFVTIERREAVSRLKIVDLPTLGRPTITTEGSFSVIFSVHWGYNEPKREARKLLVYPTGHGNRSVAPPANEDYHKIMPKAKEFDLDRPTPVIEDEDEKTLAAIDEGIRDAEAGRTIPIEKVRKQLQKWITASSSRKER